MYRLSARSTRHLEGVDPRLIAVIQLALTISKVDFGIPKTGGFRTVDDQNRLFISGDSPLDGLVKISRHQSGKAFDVFAYVDGGASWDFDDLAEVATAILSAASKLGTPLTWGGHFKSYVDGPHFEIDERYSL